MFQVSIKIGCKTWSKIPETWTISCKMCCFETHPPFLWCRILHHRRMDDHHFFSQVFKVVNSPSNKAEIVRFNHLITLQDGWWLPTKTTTFYAVVKLIMVTHKWIVCWTLFASLIHVRVKYDNYIWNGCVVVRADADTDEPQTHTNNKNNEAQN